MDDLSGRAVGGFDVVEPLGEGGYAMVYLARQRSRVREVALKVLHAALARDPDAARRFEREGRAAAALDHPNIVPVHAAGEDQGIVYLAMRLVRGGTLQDLLEAHGSLDATQTLRVIAPVAAALEHAHGMTVVHRDVKPANILLEGDRVWLSDFGIAVAAQKVGRYTSGGIGSAQYMAPEQAQGLPGLGPPADLYSLACTTFHCLTGREPYRRPTQLSTVLAHLNDPVPSTGVPALDAFFASAMAKDPAARPQSGTAFVAALEAALQPTGPSPAPLAAPPPGPLGQGGPSGPFPPGPGGSGPAGLPPDAAGAGASRGRAGYAWFIGGLLAVLLVGAGAAVLALRSGGDAGAADPTGEGTADEDGGTATFAPGEDGATEGVPQALSTLPATGVEDGDIAFVGRRDGQVDLYLVAADGTGLRQLTDDPAPQGQPAWSPDGTTLAYSAPRPDGGTSLWLLDPYDGAATPRQLTDGVLDADPDWSPDGTVIAYVGIGPVNQDIFTVEVATGTVTLLGGTEGIDQRPAWRPTGGEVAFHSDVEGTFDIWQLPVEGGPAERLVGLPDADDRSPTWGGTDVLLFESESDTTLIRRWDGDGSPTVLGTEGGQASQPDVAPSGRQLVYRTVRDGRSVLRIHTFGGAGMDLVDLEGEDPAWGPAPGS